MAQDGGSGLRDLRIPPSLDEAASSRPRVLTACVMGLSFSVGPVLITGTSVLVIPISNATGWGRGSVASLVTVGLLSMAIAPPLVGRLVALHGARKVILASTLAFMASLVGLALAPNIPVALCLAMLAGLSGTGAAQSSYLTVLPYFFGRRLGFSFGIAMLGVGLGNTAMPIIVEHLLHYLSWRETYLALATVVALIPLTGVIFVLRDPPAALRDLAERAAPGISARQALTTSSFWMLALCFFLAAAVTSGIGVSLISLLRDRGYGLSEASRVFALWGFGLLAMRLLSGILFDYADARWIGFGCLAAAAFGTAILAIGWTGAAVTVAALLVAMAHGMEGDLVPFLARRYFGLRDYSEIYGCLAFAFGIGAVAGSMLMSASFTWLGSYTPMLWVSLVMMAAAAAMLALMAPAAANPWDSHNGGRP